MQLIICSGTTVLDITALHLVSYLLCFNLIVAVCSSTTQAKCLLGEKIKYVLSI